MVLFIPYKVRTFDRTFIALDQFERPDHTHEWGAELRTDFLEEDVDLEALIRKAKFHFDKVCVTPRHKSEAGRDQGWQGTEKSRVEHLEAAARARADYLDVEGMRYRPFDKGHSQLALSFHDFSGIPPLRYIDRVADLANPDIVKVAAMARDWADVCTLVQWCAKKTKTPKILAVMQQKSEKQPYGPTGRVLSYILGSKWMFVSSGDAAATGQVHYTKAPEALRIARAYQPYHAAQTPYLLEDFSRNLWTHQNH